MAERKYKYGLKKFDAESFVSTATRWRKEMAFLGVDVLVNDYERLLVWASSHISYDAHGQSFYYGVYNGDATAADAIAEVSYFKKGGNSSWLKVLDLHLSPHLKNLTDTEKIDVQQLGHILVGTVAETLRLTHNDHPSKVVKLYARTNNLLQFFRVLCGELNSRGKLKNIKIDIEGRWLVFRKP